MSAADRMSAQTSFRSSKLLFKRCQQHEVSPFSSLWVTGKSRLYKDGHDLLPWILRDLLPWSPHLSMLMAQRLRILAVHIITSRVTKISQWIRLNLHSPTTCKVREEGQKKNSLRICYGEGLKGQFCTKVQMLAVSWSSADSEGSKFCLQKFQLESGHMRSVTCCVKKDFLPLSAFEDFVLASPRSQMMAQPQSKYSAPSKPVFRAFPWGPVWFGPS